LGGSSPKVKTNVHFIFEAHQTSPLAQKSHLGHITSMREHPCQIYLITPPQIPDLGRFCHDLRQALAAGADHRAIAALQIRLKDTPEADIIAITEAIKPICWEKDVAVIMNDHVALSKHLGCDGVHLGQDDMPLRDARKILGPKAMIGVTCHNSRHLAIEAAENSADYIAFGAFFPTTTKVASHKAEPEILRIWQDFMQIPCVAIGGIDAQNAGIVAHAGADFIAVSSFVWTHKLGTDAAINELIVSIK
jgi:thiamine-phosphate pyrophosphorylase